MRIINGKRFSAEQLQEKSNATLRDVSTSEGLSCLSCIHHHLDMSWFVERDIFMECDILEKQVPCGKVCDCFLKFLQPMMAAVKIEED